MDHFKKLEAKCLVMELWLRHFSHNDWEIIRRMRHNKLKNSNKMVNNVTNHEGDD